MLRAWLGALVVASLAAACSASDASTEEESSSGSGGEAATGGSGSTGPGSGSGGSPACQAGLPAGFAATPAAYAVPTPRCQEAFDAPAKESGESIVFRLVDLTGDAAPDLVVSSDGCDATVGDDHWDLYPGGTDGFAASPAPYTIPAARCAERFDALSKGDGYSAVSYSLLSLAGHGLPDLIVTSDECDEDVGRTHWDRYPAQTAGFTAVPAPFAVPAPRCDEEFDAVAKDGSYSAMGFFLADLTADGAPDLVVTSDECDPGVGQSRWDVYVAGSDGFAASPAPYAVPTARCQERFDAAFKNVAFAALTFGLMDLTGDGRPDLVVSSDDCDGGVGQDHWDIYAGEANGFAAAPLSYGVPAPRCQEKFDGVASEYGAALGFALVDLSCDGRPDLVVTADSCDAPVGQDHWDVYEAGTSGFAAAPAPLAVPAPRCNTPFDALARFEGTTYGLNPLPKAVPALVVFADQCDAAVGDSHWDIYTLP